MTILGGIGVSVLLVLPPLFCGVAAFSAHRDPQATALMHDLGVLCFTTTDEYPIFLWVPVVVMCFVPT